MFTFAQVVGYSFEHLAILIIVVAAIVAVVFVALNKMGIAIPDWIVSLFWIVVAAVVSVMVVKFLAGLG